MRKLLSYILVLVFTLPLMAQEVEIKETNDKTEVTVKKQHDKKKWNRMNRLDKRMMMAKRKEMRKKRFCRSVVRVVVIGGVFYYIGYTQGQKK